MSRLIQLGALQRGEDAPIGFVRKLPHHRSGRPAECLGRITIGFRRIDPTGEEALQCLVYVGLTEPSLHQGIEAERGQVPLVKYQRVPLGDGPAVIRLVCDEVEERV